MTEPKQCLETWSYDPPTIFGCDLDAGHDGPHRDQLYGSDTVEPVATVTWNRAVAS